MKQELPNLAIEDLRLGELQKLGWRVESNGYKRYFRHKSLAAAQIPTWVNELVNEERTKAADEVRLQFRQLLGLTK